MRKSKRYLSVLVVITMFLVSFLTMFSTLVSAEIVPTMDKYQRVDLGGVGGVAGLRGGLNYYKNNIPIGGNLTDGGQLNIPWFSSNSRHTQKTSLNVNGFESNSIYVLAGNGWWGWGDTMEGKPILKVTVNGDTRQEFYLISGQNIWDWNANSPLPLAKNTEKIGIKDAAVSNSYVTKFDFPKMKVTSIELQLVATTKADNSKLDGQQIIEMFGLTLGREGVDRVDNVQAYSANDTKPENYGEYKKLDLASPGAVAGLRGGEFRFKDKVPMGGNIKDGGKFELPWFSSNKKHTQTMKLKASAFKANTLYICASYGWWGYGDGLLEKPIIRVRLNGSQSKEIYLLSGLNVWDWNANSPLPLAKNTEKVGIVDPYVSSSYVTKFVFPSTVVDDVDIELLQQTAAYDEKDSNQQMMELFGVTLGNEGLDTSSSNQTSTPGKTLPTVTAAPINNAKATLNGTAIDVGVKLWWDEFSKPNLGYRLYRSKVKSEDGISVTDFPIESPSFIDANVKPQTTYYYNVRALLKEANPLADEKEVLSEPLNVCMVTTKDKILGDDPNKKGSKNFILMKLDDPNMTVAGQKKEVDPGRGTKPVILKNRTMIPIRAAVEAMGGTVDWVGNESKIVIKCNNTELLMWLGKKEISVNGVIKEIDVAPESINGRTMVPVRFVAENLKCEIEWIASTREIVVIYWN